MNCLDEYLPDESIPFTRPPFDEPLEENKVIYRYQ